MSYHIFKNNFKSAAREDILTASDIINEASNWTKGRPKNIVRTYLGNKNPETALKLMWNDLDQFYGLKTTSIEERVKTFSKGQKFEREDLEAHRLNYRTKSSQTRGRRRRHRRPAGQARHGAGHYRLKNPILERQLLRKRDEVESQKIRLQV